MSTATKTLIAATVKITKMDSDQMQTALLEILASNPSIILKVLDVATPSNTYKVVLNSKTANKIGLIKCFREVTGAGLADSKGWSEGNTYRGLPSGTFKNGLTREEADHLANEMNHRASSTHTSNGYTSSPTGIAVKVVRDSEPHDYRALVGWVVDKEGELYP